MTTIERNGVTLSAGAVINGGPMPLCASTARFAAAITMPGRGDFAGRLGGRIRRMERRNRLMVKLAGYEG